MRIEIELIGDKADKYEISTQILDILLKTSANIGYKLEVRHEDGQIFNTSSKLQTKKNRWIK